MREPYGVRTVQGYMIDFPTGQDRIDRLEKAVDTILERLEALERDVAVIKATMATKVDIANLRIEIAEARNATILWVVSAVFLAQALPLIAKWLERYF